MLVIWQPGKLDGLLNQETLKMRCEKDDEWICEIIFGIKERNKNNRKNRLFFSVFITLL